MVPEKLLAGETKSACLSLHNLELPAHVHLELSCNVAKGVEELLTRTDVVMKSGKHKCNLNKSLNHVTAMLIISIRLPAILKDNF